MPRIYSVPFSGTVTAAGGDTDLFSFQPADDRPIKIRAFTLNQISVVGDANEKAYRITVRRMTATVTIGSGGSSITAAAPINDAGGSTWAFTARANDATVSTTSGTNQVLNELGWDVRMTPFEKIYADLDFCPTAKQTEALIIRLETTLSADMTFNGDVTVEEA